MRAIVTARSSSIARAMRHPLSASSRGERPSAGAPPPKADTSAPAENARPRPDTTTTLRSSWVSSQRAATSISCNVCEESGLSWPAVEHEHAVGAVDRDLDGVEPRV